MATIQDEARTIQRMIAAAVMTAIAIMLISGCADNPSETRLTMETLRDIAQSGNVQGNVRVRLTGMGEAGMKNGVYFGTEGSFVEGDLQYRFSEKPTTQPAMKESE